MKHYFFYIDIDGCLRDLVGAIDRLYVEKFPGEEPVPSPHYELNVRYPLWGDETDDIVFRQYVDRLFNHDARAHSGSIEAVNMLHSQEDTTVKLLSKQDALRVPLTDAWLDRVGIDSSIERLYVDGMSKGEYLMGELVQDELVLNVVIDDSYDELESIGTLLYDVVPVMVARIWNSTYQESWDNWLISNVTKDDLWLLLVVARCNILKC